MLGGQPVDVPMGAAPSGADTMDAGQRLPVPSRGQMIGPIGCQIFWRRPCLTPTDDHSSLLASYKSSDPIKSGHCGSNSYGIFAAVDNSSSDESSDLDSFDEQSNAELESVPVIDYQVKEELAAEAVVAAADESKIEQLMAEPMLSKVEFEANLQDDVDESLGETAVFGGSIGLRFPPPADGTIDSNRTEVSDFQPDISDFDENDDFQSAMDSGSAYNRDLGTAVTRNPPPSAASPRSSSNAGAARRQRSQLGARRGHRMAGWLRRTTAAVSTQFRRLRCRDPGLA